MRRQAVEHETWKRRRVELGGAEAWHQEGTVPQPPRAESASTILGDNDYVALMALQT